MYSMNLSQVSKKNKREILHNCTVETSKSYKMLLPNDLETFRTYSGMNLGHCPWDECPEFQYHCYFEAAFYAVIISWSLSI